MAFVVFLVFFPSSWDERNNNCGQKVNEDNTFFSLKSISIITEENKLEIEIFLKIMTSI